MYREIAKLANYLQAHFRQYVGKWLGPNVLLAAFRETIHTLF